MKPYAMARWREVKAGVSHVCTLVREARGWELAGAGTARLEWDPVPVRFEVFCDDAWRTREVDVRAGRRHVRLTKRAGGWHADGDPITELEGCEDVDLMFTPATNTLPIRRLDLDVGATAEVAAAWVKLPDLTIERLDQRYTRLTDRTYRYESGSFEADLEVDDQGLVLDYPGLWVRDDGRG